MVLDSLRKLIGGASFSRRPAGRRRIRLSDPLPVIYAVGDVHGCLSELREAEQRIVDDPLEKGERKLIIMLGDYVDRGPHSFGVIDHLLKPPPAGIERICLCGNHDEAMAKFVRDPSANLSWLEMGGHAAMRSYGIDTVSLLRASRSAALRAQLAERVPARHLAFIDALPVSVAAGTVLFVHAGVDPSLPLDQQSDTAMMWIREPFLTHGPGFPMTIVHGHSPARDITTGPGRIGIDTAAFQTGILSVLRVRDGTFTLI
jgi:serine/threonine protein phosphatase 1